MGIAEVVGVAPATALNHHYVGIDRRARVTNARAPRHLLLGSLGVVVLFWMLFEADRVVGDTRPYQIDVAALARLLEAVTVALGAVVGLLAFVRWRLIGEARPLWLAAGAVVMGPVAVGVGSLLPVLIHGPAHPGIPEVRVAGMVAAVVLFIAAAAWHEIDSRLRASAAMGAGLALTAATAAALVLIPVLKTPSTSQAAWVALAATWLVASALHLRTARAINAITHETIAVAAISFALAELLFSGTSGAGSVWTPVAGAGLLRTIGFGLLVVRGLRDLESAFVTQRARLLETEIGREAEAARRRAEHHAHEERAHDAKNSLLAIEGAAVTLERYRDRLDPDRRAQLVEAVSGEIARLQQLIAARGPDTSETFGVADLLGPVIAAEQARGLVVELQVADDLTAVGKTAETVEVLRNLLDNARRYAPGSPVTVRTAVDGHWAVIFVEDRGRGIQRQERETIFERGRRGEAASDTDGSGLGLFVSRRLMLDQGGDVWVESRSGGGASFGLCLPLGPTPGAESASEARVSIRRGT